MFANWLTDYLLSCEHVRSNKLHNVNQQTGFSMFLLVSEKIYFEPREKNICRSSAIEEVQKEELGNIKIASHSLAC